MVGVSGEIDIEFDDFDEIKEHPMAAPALVNFSDLWEGMNGNSKEELLKIFDKRGDFEKELDKEHRNDLKFGIEANLALLDLMENISEEGLIETKVLLPDRGFLHMKVDAPGY